jgi:hypothetical protein
MFKQASRLFRALLLTGLFAGASLHCLGQDDIDFSVAPSLTPALTDANPNTALVTTVSTDLLAPQRIFTYDSTGANIDASSLDPTVRTDLLPAEAETDTAIRDSSQTGQTSPYSSGGSRVSTLFSRAGSSTDSGNGSSSESPVASSSNSSSTGYGRSYGTDFGDTTADASGAGAGGDQSSWGATSTSSSWGGRSSGSARSGSGSSASVVSSNSLGSGIESGSSLSGNQRSATVDDVYRARAIPTIGWRPTGLSLSRSTLNGVPSSISRIPTSFGASATDRFVARPGQEQDPYASAGSFAGPQASSGAAFSFSPDSAGSSSPFRGLGDGDFLRPNILRASKLPLAPRRSGKSSTEHRSRDSLQDAGTENALDTSASDYGLRPVGNSSRSRSAHGKAAKHINPYLSAESTSSGASSN